MYKCKYFTIKELVHPNFLKLPENTCWLLFDERLLRCADEIRKKFGACTVNGNGLFNCGLREINSRTGAKYSQHKFGRGLDLHILSIEKKGLSKEEKIRAYNNVREQIMLDYKFDVLNFEHNISWLHIETSNRDKRLFNP